MIRIENTDVSGFEAAIRGMRNPLNSWDKSDSHVCMATYGEDCSMCEYDHEPAHECNDGEYVFCVGVNDYDLMMKLAKAGTEHAKFLRMIIVTADIVAPDYWFKEFSTYRVGVTENSTSTMHRIHSKEFTADDFSHEWIDDCSLDQIIAELNFYRNDYNNYEEYVRFCKEELEYTDAEITPRKALWYAMIQLLPMSYNYRRTVCLNYQVLANMYRQRRNHKLDEWHDFCEWIESLPYSELITGKSGDE